MALDIAERCPLSELSRGARRLVERTRDRQEPIIITQRGRDVAVLLPVELYRQIEQSLTYRIASPRLVNPGDADQFRVEMSEA